MDGDLQAEDIRRQLDRILRSDEFAHAGRHSRVLRYLVERTLAGQGDQLKEYVLGTEVFDRGEAYDPRLDSIVRVEVRRLRSRLEEYYRGPGVADPIEIAIPRGSYVPVFSRRDLEPAAPELAGAAPPVVAPPSALRAAAVRAPTASHSFAVIAAAVVVAVILIVGTLAVNTSRTTSAQASSAASIAVLPFEHYSSDPGDAWLAARMTDAVTTELARLGVVSVASRTSASRFDDDRRPMPEIGAALNVTFVVEASAVRTATGVQVSARLVDAQRDRKVWVGDYTCEPAAIALTATRIAADVADAALTYAPR